MIGKNSVILNEATVNSVLEKYLKDNLFRDDGFIVTNIDKRSYDTEWKITLEGTEDDPNFKEAEDATES